MGSIDIILNQVMQFFKWGSAQHRTLVKNLESGDLSFLTLGGPMPYSNWIVHGCALFWFEVLCVVLYTGHWWPALLLTFPLVLSWEVSTQQTQTSTQHTPPRERIIRDSDQWHTPYPSQLNPTQNSQCWSKPLVERLQRTREKNPSGNSVLLGKICCPHNTISRSNLDDWWFTRVGLLDLIRHLWFAVIR